MSAKVSAHYISDKGARYTAERQSDAEHLGYQLNLEHFAPYLASHQRVLDFGCGNGGMLRLLPGHVREAVGLEVNLHSRRVAESTGLQVFADIGELPKEQFDVVVSNHVLEHVRDASSTLETLRGALKPGGLVLLKLPLDDWRARGQRQWDSKDVDHHLHTWTPRLLANTLTEAGFRVTECRVLTSAWHPRLFPLVRLGFGKPISWALAAALKRRQLFAVGVNDAG